VIEGKEQFIERWGVLARGATTLVIQPQYQEVALAVIPANVLPMVKVDGRDRPERPLRLRWGMHRFEVQAGAGGAWFPFRDNISIPVPDGRLEIRLQQDYRDQVVAKLRSYYDKGDVLEIHPDAPEAADRTVALVEAVEIMENCPPNHPQFLELRYTVASVLAREGYVPEAVMTLMDYQAGTGLAGAMEEEVRIVVRGAFSSFNPKLPRTWMWQWFNDNPLSSIDKLDLPDRITLPSRAKGGELSAEDTGKVYRYLLGVLLYQYAKGKPTGEQYLASDLDRALAYLVAYHYLSEHNWPSLGRDPFLNETLSFYSLYYSFRTLDELCPLVSRVSSDYDAAQKDLKRLLDKMREGGSGRITERVKRERGKLLLKINLAKKHSQLTGERARLGNEFLRRCKRLKAGHVFTETTDAARREVVALEKEVKNKMTGRGVTFEEGL